MQSPQVSVIIPLYNKERIVERSVRSVLTQTFQDFELIIVDDGSTDGSMDVVKGIHDDRIVLISQENGGPGKARNTGVSHAKGDWIVFLDADDELFPETLERLYDVTNKHADVDIVDGAYVERVGKKTFLHARKDRKINNNFKSFFYKDIFPSTGHSLFHRNLLVRYPYDTSLRRYEDVNLIVRLLKDAKIVTISYVMFCINVEYCSASHPRLSIKDDYMGYLDFRHKGFWERMCLYQFYLGERPYYPEDVRRLYPMLRWRFDLLLIYHILLFLRRIHVL